MHPAPPARRSRRRLAAGLLLIGLTALHLGLADRLLQAWPRAADSRPARLKVAFVRTLQPQAPSPVAALARPAPKAAAAALPAELPASAAAAPDLPPVPPAETPEPPEAPEAPEAPEPTQSAPEPALAAASTPADPPPADVASTAGPPAASASAPAFEWPPSTRLRYVLTGHYRGPIDGSAQVQWLRQGTHYQVHLDVHIGPPFAAIIERQMSSDGSLGADGLRPRRYDERTHIAFREPRSLSLFFDADTVQLAGGGRVPRPPGVQDAVSQFVQLTWRFTLQPALLSEGQVIELPLVLPRRVETWVYDVRASETLWTPVGAIEAVHVQPRREPRPGGDLVAEMWFAPTLQYLPVRIKIRQDAQTWIDLLVDRLPEQAGAVPTVPEQAGVVPTVPEQAGVEPAVNGPADPAPAVPSASRPTPSLRSP
jgi:hypothetical protein